MIGSYVCLSYFIQCFITFKILQGHPRSCAPSAPADVVSVSDSWLSWMFLLRTKSIVGDVICCHWHCRVMLLTGTYVRYDLNMPKSMPKRRDGPQNFSSDSPLTVQGHFQARLLGTSSLSHSWLEGGWHVTGPIDSRKDHMH